MFPVVIKRGNRRGGDGPGFSQITTNCNFHIYIAPYRGEHVRFRNPEADPRAVPLGWAATDQDFPVHPAFGSRFFLLEFVF